MKNHATAAASWDRTMLGLSVAIMAVALTVIVGWHAHIATIVQVFPGLVPMQYNSALCFLALGVSGVGLASGRRTLQAGGGAVAALMGAAVVVEYWSGTSFGIDTLFFYPWERSLSAHPGRMALTTAISFALTGGALVILGLRHNAYSIFGILNLIPPSLALTSLIGYAFQITYVLPFVFGSQMAIHTSAAFLAHGVAMLRYAWLHSERGADGLPKWCAAIGVALLPALLVGASALLPPQTWAIVPLEALIAVAGVGLVALAVRGLTVAKVAYKGLLMIAIPLGLLLVFAGLVSHVKRQSETAQAWALHSTQVIGVSQFLLAQVTEAESAVHGYVLTGETSFLNAYRTSAEPVARTATQFRELVSDNPRQQASVTRIQRLTAEKMARLAQTVALALEGNKTRAGQRIQEESGLALMIQLCVEMSAFSRQEESLATQRQETLDASWQRLSWLLVSGTAAAIMLAGILSILFTGGISKRLRRLRDNAVSLAAGQALAPPLTGHDEIAELDRVFHAMAASLAESTRREIANRVLREQTTDVLHTEALLKTGALQSAIFNSANFSSIATDAKGVIQIFNVGAERMLGYLAAEVVNTITPADISDPQEVVARAKSLSLELGTEITPGFEALVFKASRGIEDIYELTYIRKDGSRFPAVVSVTALRDAADSIIGYLLIGTDNTARKQAEEALLQAGALQSAIFNSANFSSIATDAGGVIQIFNVGAERMLGYTAAEVMNKITPADISDPQEVVARAKSLSLELGTEITPGFEALVFKASRGIEDIYELTYFRKDGSRFPAIVSVTALRDAADSIIGYLLIGTDNTARKQAEEALLQAGALQSAIFNSANFSSIATDAKGVIQIFNVGAERMLGYTAAEVMNKITPAEISDPQEVIARARSLSLELGTEITPGFEALVFKASRGIEDIYELTYFRKDGSRFPAIVSVTALRDAADTIIGYLLIGTDNTARKQVEAAQALLDQRLREQQFYTRSLIESNIDALMMTDPQGIISDVNQQFIALTGRTRDELIGAPSKNFFTDPVLADAAIRRVLIEGRLSNYELTVRAFDGQETVVSYNAATFHDRDRKLQGVFAAARDVTERKRFEHALQEKNVELEHASRMKSEFLATMSHELRTPLNAIIGFSEALKDGLIGDMSAVQYEYMGDIFNSGQHLLSLINDILDLSKVEAGMMALELEAVDLNALLSGALTIVREKAAAQQIRLELDAGKELGKPQLDMRKTKQIVYNLLSNAVKFSASGGHVTLRARRVARSEVGHLTGNWPVHGFPLADSADSEFLEIAVSDDGIGISTENMTKLFQAFSQIDSSLARRFEGTGLGLAMVRQLAELQGGTVAVASAPGQGACFAVWVPLRWSGPGTATTLPAADADAAPRAAADPEQGVALVIDDDDQAADLVRLLLEAEGFTVLRAASAEAALLMGPRQTLSLITLDIHLPGMDGWEYLLRIRESGALAYVPVVIVSGSADVSMALARGAAAVLQKPISRAQLKISLANLGLHPTATHTHTVMIVDDDPKAIEVIAAFLPAPAYAVVRAHGGNEAITLARQLRPDLILLDLMMPEVSGFDVIAALRRGPDTASIPIMVVTAKDITARDRAALNTDTGKVIDIVQKAGFNSERFVSDVRRALVSH